MFFRADFNGPAIHNLRFMGAELARTKRSIIPLVWPGIGFEAIASEAGLKDARFPLTI